ncbi:MAG: CRISPR-associated helicase Cas3' [Sporolactobacillus sp.]
MKIEDYFCKGSVIYAHVDPQNDQRKETLKDHSELVRYYFQKLCKENHLSFKPLFSNLILDDELLDKYDQDFLMKCFENAIYLHDIGKLNTEFQRVKMGSHLSPSAYNNTNHSLFSALLYLDICEEKLIKIQDEDKRAFFRYLFVLFSYVISRHHTYLTDFDLHDYAQKLNAAFEQISQNEEVLYFYNRKDRFKNWTLLQKTDDGMNYRLECDDVCISDQNEGTTLFLLLKMLYSCLVTSDFLATYQFFNHKKPYFYYLNASDKKKLFHQFHQTPICQNIRDYKINPDNYRIAPINQLRSKLFIETENELAKFPDRSIYYLEAPTGSGKTIISTNLALNLLKRHQDLTKIIYVFPFNTLVEQTKEKLDEWSVGLDQAYRIQVVNSVTPIITEKEKQNRNEYSLSEEMDYDEELLRRQMLLYPITVTSHVNLFNHLFGTGRESNLGLATLVNSVVILDEIQSYRNDIWPEMIRMLDAISKQYHIVFIIMSATLPKLDRLLNEKEAFTSLVVHKKDYFQNPVFKDRVHLNFNLLNQGTLTLDQLVESVKKVKTEHGAVRMLVELIKKKSARFLYDRLRMEMPDQILIELTGDDSRFARRKVLERIQGTDKISALKDVIIIATQVIEAGVDIDMDIGMKDISLLDSEEQFLGRINRSALKKNCWAYFFDMDASNSIYKNDLRLENDLRNPVYQKALINKDFEQFYNLVFKRFSQLRGKRDQSYQLFDRQLSGVKFEKISQIMTLIKEQTYSLVLNFSIRTDKGELLGGKVWEAYKTILKNDKMTYSEQKVRLSQISENLDYFTFKIFKKPQFYDENIGLMYYVQNCEDFIEWDEEIGTWKYRPDNYANQSEGSFL